MTVLEENGDAAMRDSACGDEAPGHCLVLLRTVRASVKLRTARDALSSVVEEFRDVQAVADACKMCISVLDSVQEASVEMHGHVTTMKRKYDELDDEVEQMEKQMNQIQDSRNRIASKRDRIKLVADAADKLITVFGF